MRTLDETMIWVVLAFIVLVLFVLIGLHFYFQYQAALLRRQMWQQIAARLKMRYSPKDRWGIPNKFKFALFQEGRRRRVSNCLDGMYQKVPVILFDYRYLTGWGRSEKTHELSALLARLNIKCPHLVVRPETAMGRFAAFLGMGDIQFEFEEFNRTFNVKCEDKKFAYDVCHPEMMEFLLRYPTMTWELHGNHLLIYCFEMKFDRQCVALCLEAASGFAKLIPRYLQAEQKA